LPPAARQLAKARSATRQAVTILRVLHALTGKGELLFPSIRSAHGPMSDNTLNAALRRLGYGNDEGDSEWIPRQRLDVVERKRPVFARRDRAGARCLVPAFDGLGRE
jgi:hypothetical protein